MILMAIDNAPRKTTVEQIIATTTETTAVTNSVISANMANRTLELLFLTVAISVRPLSVLSILSPLFALMCTNVQLG